MSQDKTPQYIKLDELNPVEKTLLDSFLGWIGMSLRSVCNE